MAKFIGMVAGMHCWLVVDENPPARLWPLLVSLAEFRQGQYAEDHI